MKLKKIRQNQGFSLLEMILVLALSSLAFVGLLNYEKRRTDNMKAESVGQQFAEVGQALSSYIVDQNSNLTANIPTGTTATMPLTVLQGTNSGFYVGRQFLPTTYNPVNGFGTNYVLQIKNNGPTLTGMVISSAPIKDGTGSVRYDWLGYALRKAGSQSGNTFFSTNTVTGLNAGWSLTNADFPAINAAGLLAYRSQYENNYDNLYLRRDGLYPMTGNLNMGNFNVNNATDINYTGWLNGNNALLNNLKTGYIYNTGNMRNDGDIQTVSINGQGTTAHAPGGNYANFDRLYGNVTVETGNINKDSGADVKIGNGTSGNLYVKDIYLTTGQSGRAINSWLSDRLPKYSSRGMYLVGNGSAITKVNCGATAGTAKIEVVPQSMYIQGRVMGKLYPQTTTSGGNTTLSIYQNEDAVSAISAYAVDMGSYWNVYVKTPSYWSTVGGVGPDPYTTATALAHVYCDYGT